MLFRVKMAYLCSPFKFGHRFKENNMLIINVKDQESIDRALKRYKRKVQRTGMIKELRRRKNFTKPSVERRNEVLNAVYREKYYSN